VDAILKPDPELPQPMGPATENAAAMRGQEPKVFPMQDHAAHIQAHAEYMFTRMVQINPQLYAMLQAHISDHVATMSGQQVEQEYKPQFDKLNQSLQQAQQNPQAQQQIQQQMDQLTNEAAGKQAQIEAQMTQQLAQDEEARMSREQQDPLIKLKQQEIDLKAMETTARLQKDMMTDAEKLDLERDKLESQTSIDIMKLSADMDKTKTAEANSMLKENISTAREAMKSNSQERIARTNARSKANGSKNTKN